MIDIEPFLDRRLPGGFYIIEIQFTEEPLIDALGREALAQTRIVGSKFRLKLAAGLPEEEVSISLYHEILEAATVAALRPPENVMELNEAGFEAAAVESHRRWGMASPINLDRMLHFFGFEE